MTAYALLLVRWIVLALAGAALSACATSFKDPGPLTHHAPGARPAVDYSGTPQQCAPFARKHSGVMIYGDAHTWWDQADDKYETEDAPKPGAVMVMRGYQTDLRGHVAVVRKLLTERQMTVDHANWLNKGEVQLDTPVLDVSADNDWSRVRVWNIEGGHFGGRVYSVKGFIVPERRTAEGLNW